MSRSTKAPKIALITLAALSFAAFVLPWAGGIPAEQWPTTLRWILAGVAVLAMAILGRDMRAEEPTDTWAGNPQKSRLENWLDKRRQRFSARRGLGYFVVALFVFPIPVLVDAVGGNVGSIQGAAVFVAGMSILAGLIGMFTEKTPF